ncbi:MAG TPA: cobalamin-dependent protein [Polyangia bacterium]
MRVTLAGTRIAAPGAPMDEAQSNLALGSLQAYLQQRAPQGLELHRKDFPITLADPVLPAGAIDRLLAEDPEVVGLSSYCWDSDAFRDAAAALKRRAPGITVIIGGATATYGGLALMQRAPAIDLAVRGEGEETLLELLTGGLRRPGEVAGVLYRDGDAIRETPPRPPIADLGALPSPYLTGVMRPPREQLPVQWSRGCVFRCKYCAWKDAYDGLRCVAPAAAAAELRWARAEGYRHAYVLDSALNFDTARLRALAAAVGPELGPEPGPLRLSFYLSHAHYGAPQQGPLRALQPHSIWLGLESLNPAALRAIQRPPVDLRRFTRALDELSALAPVMVSVILGIPGDDLAGFKATLDAVTALAEDGPRRRIAIIQVFWMLVAPGSAFDERRQELGVRTAAPGMPYLLDSRSFPQPDLEAALRYLFTHPRRDLLHWDDPHPEKFFPALAGLPPLKSLHAATRSIPERAAASAPTPPSAPAGLPLATAQELLPDCVPGAAVVNDWRVAAWTEVGGWPTLCLERPGREARIQIRRRDEQKPCFARTRSFDLTWLADPGPPGAQAKAGRELQRVFDLLTAAIARRDR